MKCQSNQDVKKNSICRVETEVTSNQGQNLSPNVIKCSLSSETYRWTQGKGGNLSGRFGTP